MSDTTSNQNSGCLTWWLQFLGIQSKTAATPSSEQLPYRIRDEFLSPAEMSFYHVITLAVGQRVTICPKVNLADIFFIVRPNENFAYRGRIAQKHLDFLLCEPKSMRPIVGIELDDSSHQRVDRQARDQFVDQVFQAAGLPLLHVAVKHSYDVNELTAQLARYLEKATPVENASPRRPLQTGTGTTISSPLCPKCGTPMVVRTTKRGEHHGEQFYGCSNYPRCRQVLPLSRVDG